MSKTLSEIDIIDSLYADTRVSWGIVHGSAVALEHSGECNPETIAAALRYVETAQERIIEHLGKLDALRQQRTKPTAPKVD